MASASATLMSDDEIRGLFQAAMATDPAERPGALGAAALEIRKARDLVLGEKLLTHAAKAGCLSTCEWVAAEFALGPPIIPADALRLAAEGGHLGVCKWLKARFVLGQSKARWELYLALRAAATNGHLPICEWLAAPMPAGFGLAADDARDCDNAPLGGAAKNGHLDVCVWLKNTFDLRPKDARASEALRHAAANGHLRVCKWLAAPEPEGFGLWSADARSDQNRALRNAAEGGHLDVCKWLTATFGLQPYDARVLDNSALYRAATHGHLDVCKWLKAEFGLGYADVAACGSDDILGMAARRGYIDVCEWLTSPSGFGLGPRHAREALPLLSAETSSSGYAWLVAMAAKK